MIAAKSTDEYISKSGEWQEALILLRDLLRSTKLKETIKWNSPIYTINNKNVVGIAAFKNHVALWFHNGVLLKDKHNKLINAQEGVTKALRQWRFNSVDEIRADADKILQYVKEAIANQEAGKEVKPAKKKQLEMPEELQQALKADVELQSAFESFPPSHQREFLEYISEAKRAETRQRRLEKIIPLIRQKVGLNDKYKKT